MRVGMRLLAIETSSARGSVALVEDGQRVKSLCHDRPNAHAESILPLIEALLASAAWPRSSLDRLAVGIGPGSFTGLRVGVATAQGIAEGLMRPLIGVVSLEAMALAVPSELPGLRCPVLDARRGEVFAAAYDAHGSALLPPFAASPDAARRRLEGLGAPLVWQGAGVSLVEPDGQRRFQHEDADLPHAHFVGVAAARREAAGPVVPLYVRDDVAVRPRLPQNPLAHRESSEKPPSSG